MKWQQVADTANSKAAAPVQVYTKSRLHLLDFFAGSLGSTSVSGQY